MQKANRLVLIGLAAFGVAILFGALIVGSGQVFASDSVERIIQPPGVRAARIFSQTLVLPSVSSDAGAPPTYTQILPAVRDQGNPPQQIAPAKQPAKKLILPQVRNSTGETAKHKLVLPQVTQQNNTPKLSAAGLPLTETLILPLVVASGATRQGATQLKAVTACTEAIQNGDLEAATPGRPWTGVANQSYRRTVEPFISTVRAHSGKQSARIGSSSLAGYWSEFIQTVELPKRTTSVTLTYWRYLDMPAASGARAADAFTAGLENEQGIQIVAPQKFDVTTAGRGTWVKSTVILPNAGAYAGKRIWVTFKGRTGASRPAALYIDDVQLSVCAVR